MPPRVRWWAVPGWLLFEHSGHDVYVQETDRFAREVTRFLRSES